MSAAEGRGLIIDLFAGGGGASIGEVAKALVAANMATIPSICRFDEGAVA
jgi:hypothetical protein